MNPTSIIQRILLSLLLLTAVIPREADAATPFYRANADANLKIAVTYALETWESSGAANSSSAYMAYFYAVYARYQGEISAWLSLYGNATLSEMYDYYCYLFSYYGLQEAGEAYVNSSGANRDSAYVSCVYFYVGNLYSLYAYFYE